LCSEIVFCSCGKFVICYEYLYSWFLSDVIWQVHLILWGVHGNSNTATTLAVESGLGWSTKSNGARLIDQTQLKLKLDQFFGSIWLVKSNYRLMMDSILYLLWRQWVHGYWYLWLAHACALMYVCVSYCVVLMGYKLLIWFP